jgi:hypothetical protein
VFENNKDYVKISYMLAQGKFSANDYLDTNVGTSNLNRKIQIVSPVLAPPKTDTFCSNPLAMENILESQTAGHSSSILYI